MRTEDNQQIVELPGTSFSIKSGMPPSTSRPNTTGGTFTMLFGQIKDLLREKPLRRPNRTRPVE